MGLGPAEVDKLSLWQFAAAWNGYVAANIDTSKKLSEREAQELFDWIDEATFGLAQSLPRVAWDGRSLKIIEAATG